MPGAANTNFPEVSLWPEEPSCDRTFHITLLICENLNINLEATKVEYNVCTRIISFTNYEIRVRLSS